MEEGLSMIAPEDDRFLVERGETVEDYRLVTPGRD